MDSAIRFAAYYFQKMYRRPIYRFFVLFIGLPAMLVTYVSFLQKKKSNSFEAFKQNVKQGLIDAGEKEKLTREVKTQLQNKLTFLNKSLSAEQFDSEVVKIVNKRLEELVKLTILEMPPEEKASELIFSEFFCAQIKKPAFFIMSLFLGFFMYIFILIYSNAYIKYIFERLFMMCFVIFGVTLLVFTILYLSPMDATLNILGVGATQEQISRFRAVHGLDQPYIIQLFRTFKGLVTFDLGKSFLGQEDVFRAIMNKFPITLQITFFSLLITIVLSIPAGILSAIKPYSAYDYVFMFAALIGLSIPVFWMGLMMILAFSIKGNNMLPAIYNPSNWKSLVMPCIVLGTTMAASVARMTRSSMLEVIRQEYIVTAKAKGLSNFKVITRHALGNAMIPIVTVVGLNFGGMLGGSAVTEKVFNINGLGSYIVDRQFIPDIPVVLAGVVYVAVVISIVNLLVDILYAFLDPRIKSKMKSY